MKVLMLSASDSQGGAARAAYRLHRGLLDSGIESRMLVGSRNTNDPQVIHAFKSEKGSARRRNKLDRLPLKFYNTINTGIFSPSIVPESLSRRIYSIGPDILNLHWVCNGFLKIETIQRFSLPTVWTLHDSWAFTGGCHVPNDCEEYIHSCGKCPQLGSKSRYDLSRWVHRRKSRAYNRAGNITFVCPSDWLADCARNSSLLKNFRVEVIPHGIDQNVFKPHDREFARNVFGLPLDNKLILFGAYNPFRDNNKGFHFLVAALKELSRGNINVVLVLFGEELTDEITKHINTNTYSMGFLHDDVSKALLYSAADVCVVPSIQESFGQTALESLACGTPVVAFNNSGIKDLIIHTHNGYLATPFDTSDLAKGIWHVISDGERNSFLSANARRSIMEDYTSAIQTRKYVELYEELT